jgi:DNA-binding transcriptional ArsR family regulator
MADEITVSIFKALADNTRLDIVREIARVKDPTSCQKASSCSTLSQPAMSHHFSKLVEARVLLEEKSGKEKIYTLNKELLEAYGINPTLI